MNDYDTRVKILMLGESDVGKSSLLTKFCEGKFVSSGVSTIGLEFKQRIIDVGHKKVMIQVWDTAAKKERLVYFAGQERFRAITPMYYKNAEGVLLVYDVGNTKSFENIQFWMNSLHIHSETQLKIVLVANKVDLIDRREVSREKGEELAATYGIPYFETSAKTNQNVVESFLENAKLILQANNISIQNRDSRNLKDELPKKSCCVN